MAKKKVFGSEGQPQNANDGKMAKVIISTKLGNNTFAYKEAMIRQNDVKDYISENKS
jgi:hypothetical protein